MADTPELHEATTKHTHRTGPDQGADHEHDHGTNLAATLGNSRVGQVLSTPGVQREGATGAQQLDESVARAIEDRRGRGRPLGEEVQAQMEDSLGHDLSNVRVHTDAAAQDLSDAVGARAFTTGDDVFFKQGTYDPSSSSGQELLAHELTHVVQQRSGTSGLAAGEISDPSDTAEREASDVGATIAANGGPTVAPTSTPAGVARVATPEDEQELQMARDPDAAVSREEEEELEERSG